MNRLAYNVNEVAEHLGISRDGVYRELAAGRLRSFHIGKLRRIAHQDLCDYVEKLRAMAAAKQFDAT